MRRILLAAALATVVAGCVTPVIPLPPPKIDRIGLTVTPGKDEIVLKGSPDPNLSGAWIFVVNHNSGRGVMRMAEPDGRFETDPLPARNGDRIHLWAAPTYYDATGDVSCGLVDFPSGKLLPCSN